MGGTRDGADFDALARAASAASGAIEVMDRLWGAAFALPEWHFIARGAMPTVRPYIASNPHHAGGRAMVRAFTDTTRAARFAAENGLTDPVGGVPLLSVPTGGIVEWLGGFIEHGAWGVWFNSDTGSEGFFGPLAALPTIRDRARAPIPTRAPAGPPPMSATSALIVGWSAAMAELAAELLALRHAAPPGSAVDHACAGCMHASGAYAVVMEAARLLPGAPSPPTNGPELLLHAARARQWVSTNLEPSSAVARAARIGLAGGSLVRAVTLLLAVHDEAWIPHLRFDPRERSADAARDGSTQLALAVSQGPLPEPLASTARHLHPPLQRFAQPCPPGALRARHVDASSTAQGVVPWPSSEPLRAALAALPADGGPGSSLGPLPPGASPGVAATAAPVAASATPAPDPGRAVRAALAAFAGKSLAVDAALRALLEHDDYRVHASLAIDPSTIVDGRVEVDVSALVLGPDARPHLPEVWIFTDDDAALAAQRAAGGLGPYLRGQRGVDVLCRLAARADVEIIRVNPGSPPEQGFRIGRDAFGVLGMMGSAIAFERLAHAVGADDPSFRAPFLALPGVATLRRKADRALHTRPGGSAPSSHVVVGFTTPDVARAFLETLPDEVRASLEQVVPQPRTLADVAADQLGATGLVLNPLGPGRPIAIARDGLLRLVGRETATPTRRSWRTVHVDRERRFALEVDEVSGDGYLSIPVRNTKVEYEERYAVDRETFARYQAEPALARDLAARAKRREVDHLLLLPPGTDRGVAD